MPLTPTHRRVAVRVARPECPNSSVHRWFAGGTISPPDNLDDRTVSEYSPVSYGVNGVTGGFWGRRRCVILRPSLPILFAAYRGPFACLRRSANPRAA